MEFVIAFFIGILSSITASMLGIGGGVVIVPLSLIFLKLSMHNAIAVSLVTIVSTSLLVTYKNIEKKIINMPMGLGLEVSTSIFAVVASLIAINLNQDVLKIAFGVFLLSLSFFMMKNSKSKYEYSETNGKFSYFDQNLNKVVYYDIKNIPMAILISSFAGFLSGMLGVGGGIVKVPILNAVCKIPIKAATATSSMMVGITAACASIVYFRHGYVIPNIVLFMSLGAVFGSKVGLYIAHKAKNEVIEKVFIALLLIVAIEMIVKALI